jgi:hypothetical protein
LCICPGEFLDKPDVPLGNVLEYGGEFHIHPPQESANQSIPPRFS